MDNKPVYDNGKNKLYDSWELLKAYGLYNIESNSEGKFDAGTKVGLKNIEGELTKVNLSSKFKQNK